jgi:hypothetical protein
MSTETKHTEASLQELANRVEILEKELAKEKARNARIGQNRDKVINGIQMVTDESTKIASGLIQASAEGVITAINHFSQMADNQLTGRRGKTAAGSEKHADEAQTHGIFKLAVDVPRHSINKFFEVYQKK